MTQYLTNPPPEVQALADMLDDCASFGLDLYYPSAPAETSGDFGVIWPVDSRHVRYAEGMAPIPSGSLMLGIYKTATIGELETFARTTQRELLTLATGLLLRGATSGRCAEAGPAMRAGGQTRKAIDITIEYGLNT